MDRDNADHIIGILDHHCAEALALANQVGHALDNFLLLAANRERIDFAFGQHHKLGQVNGVGAFTQNHALRPPLTALGEKGQHILKVLDHPV